MATYCGHTNAPAEYALKKEEERTPAAELSRLMGIPLVTFLGRLPKVDLIV